MYELIDIAQDQSALLEECAEGLIEISCAPVKNGCAGCMALLKLKEAGYGDE